MEDLSQPVADLSEPEIENSHMAGGEDEWDQDEWDAYGDEDENEFGSMLAEATKYIELESGLL